MNENSISILLGKVFTSVVNNEDTLVFTDNEGSTYEFYHDQDCCENVYIQSVVGDLEDLVGSPLLVCEEVVSDENPEGVTKEYQDSFARTFYKFATRKGYVDVRWYGESNGYYSESVDFRKVR